MTSLRPYQMPHAEKLFSALMQNGTALDASDTGTGKMYVACFLASQMGVTPLVIAPKSTLHEWNKVAAGFNVQIEAVNYELIRGVRRAETVSSYETPFEDSVSVRLAKSNWGQEAACGQGSRWQWHQPYQMMIFDEVHRCGGMTSLNSKLLIAARRQAKYILNLSATAADDPRDMKALGYALRLFEMRNFKWWLLKHGCEPGIWGGFDLHDDPRVVQKAMSGLHMRIFAGGCGARMRKSEILGFPQTQISTRLLVDDTGKAAALTRAADVAYKKGNQLKALTDARQKIELLKVPFMVEMAEDYARTSKVIIFVNYSKSITALCQKLKAKFGTPPIIDGTNTEEQREKIKTDFQANKTPVLICNNQAGGVGIGLHDPTGKVERTSIISPSFSAKDMKQVLGRPHRDGGAFSRQFLLYFADTLEERIAAAVETGLTHIDILNDNILNGDF